MGRVRCVKPKADAASIGKIAKKKVAKMSGLRHSTVGGIGPHQDFVGTIVS